MRKPNLCHGGQSAKRSRIPTPAPVGRLVVAFLAVACVAGSASAQGREFAFGVGYGHLFLDGANAGPLEEQGGIKLDVRASWPLGAPMTDQRPELRFGVGMGLALYISDRQGDASVDNGFIFFDPDVWTQLTTIEPEVQLSIRQPLGQNYWLEPGLAGTFMAGNYLKGREAFGYLDEDADRWRVGGGARAFLRAAYHRDAWSFGVEGSYSYGWLDFGGDIGGDIRQAYLGLFYAHRL